MKKFLAGLVAVMTAFAAQAGDGWMTDYDAALQLAAKENKKVLLDFTGSDWCGWCVKLQKDVFSTSEFKEFASKNLVLVEIDFPNAKPQTAEVRKQNNNLQKQYGVEGFPTLVLLDSKGIEIARNVGYLAGGPAAFADWVRSAGSKN